MGMSRYDYSQLVNDKDRILDFYNTTACLVSIILTSIKRNGLEKTLEDLRNCGVILFEGDESFDKDWDNLLFHLKFFFEKEGDIYE